MVDLWWLFVENVFGGFYLAVIGLAAIYFVILVMGGVSLLTNIYYNMIFFTIMMMGYGTRLIPALVLISLIVWFFMQLKGYIDRSAGNY